MTWKDKLEVGLKNDAPFRRDDLPDFQKSDEGRARKPGDPGRSPQEPEARVEAGTSSYAVAGRRPPRSRPKARTSTPTPGTRRSKPAARRWR